MYGSEPKNRLKLKSKWTLILRLDLLLNPDISSESFLIRLKEKIRQTKINLVKDDVRPFVKNSGDLEIWSTDYFLKLAEMLRFR
jgi:hypothetical protein